MRFHSEELIGETLIFGFGQANKYNYHSKQHRQEVSIIESCTLAATK